MKFLSWNIRDYIQVAEQSWVEIDKDYEDYEEYENIKKDEKTIQLEQLPRFLQFFDIISNENPDILCLQEASMYFINFLIEKKYHLLGKILTHGGWCCTLSKHLINVKNIKDIDQCAQLIQLDSLCLVNCHLIPSASNENYRKKTLSTIMSNITHLTHLNCLHTIIIGDLNTVGEICLDKMLDMGKMAMSDIPTWYRSYFDPQSTVSHRFDRVFSNFSSQQSTYRTLNDVRVSDHVPILFEIQKHEFMT